MTAANESDATAVAARLLRALYPLAADAPLTLHEMSGSCLEDGYIAYQVHARSISGALVQWVLRAHHHRRQASEDFCYFYPWACQDKPDDRTCDMAGWLRTRAATLIYLEELGYPSPQVVPTADSVSVGEAQDWCALVTTYVEGSVLAPTLAQLHLLGSALGQLHAISELAPMRCRHGAQDVVPGLSYWHPRYAIPTARARLKAVAVHMPDAWRPWHILFEQTIEQMELAELPMHLIHGDAWSANAVADAAGRAILIDWDQGGQGPAMSDLGRLLLECHLNTDLPVDDALAWHIEPDPQRIAAVVASYARHRIPSPAELDALLVAMRFGVAFIGALHLDQAVHAVTSDPAWAAGMDRRFARLQNRFRVSEEIAALSIAHFEHIRVASGQ